VLLVHAGKHILKKGPAMRTRIIDLFLGALVAFFGLYLFVADTKLWPWEGKIVGITSEYAHRVPEFQSTIKELKICVQTSGCDAKPLIKKRDALIRAHWPQMAKRFLVHRDWGSAEQSWLSRNAFFEAIGGRTLPQILEECMVFVEVRKYQGVVEVDDYPACIP
jgi:hypothetical protein